MIGIDDEQFIRGKVPMTKREVRILTIINANIGESDVIVDIGAGTGSLSIEAALIAKSGRVFAVEKKLEAATLIQKNAEKFKIENITLINAEAPDCLQNLPKLDVVFIGGSSGKLKEILNILDERLNIGGRIVSNFVTIQSLAACLEWLKAHECYNYEAIQVQICRLQNVGFYDMSKALNPVHIVTAKKIHRKQAANVIVFGNR